MACCSEGDIRLDFLRHVKERHSGESKRDGEGRCRPSPDACASFLLRLSLGGLRPRRVRIPIDIGHHSEMISDTIPI